MSALNPSIEGFLKPQLHRFTQLTISKLTNFGSHPGHLAVQTVNDAYSETPITNSGNSYHTWTHRSCNYHMVNVSRRHIMLNIPKHIKIYILFYQQINRLYNIKHIGQKSSLKADDTSLKYLHQIISVKRIHSRPCLICRMKIYSKPDAMYLLQAYKLQI